MNLSDFYFDLPEELIAQHPLTKRTDSRLLCLDGESGALVDRVFTFLPDLLNAGDLLVFNNTRVIPARLYGYKSSGGKLEVLVERVLDNESFLAQIKASKAPKEGSVLTLGTDKGDGFQVKMTARQGDLFQLKLWDNDLQSDSQHSQQKSRQTIFSLLEAFGHIPLPPYVEREDEDSDLQRYQTVYAKEKGAVAAPTAGLHFDQNLLDIINKKGVDIAWVTLHVGAGTFQPVRVDNILEHNMHSEYVDVGAETIEKIKQTHERGNRVIAVGTTAMRSLECASMESGEIKEYHDDTDIFIYPGYEFKTVDAMITNFHLPESTLIMLISAFAGLDHVKKAYQHAIHERYRFFSYGDAMFITPSQPRSGLPAAHIKG